MTTDHPRILPIGLCVSLSLLGCQAPMEPGIDRREAKVLQTAYYWRPETQPSTYTEHRYLESLFLKATDPTLDGGRSELLTSRLVLALAVVGDAEFAARLAGQERSVKIAVLRSVSSVWRSHDELSYPATEDLWQTVGSPR